MDYHFFFGRLDRISASKFAIAASPSKAKGDIIKSGISMPETVPLVSNEGASVREKAAAFSSINSKC